MVGQFIRSLTESREQRAAVFDQMMEQSYRPAFGVAYRLTGNHTEAEDLLQETFVRAFRFFHRYDQSLPFTSWLYRIMTNLHIDRMRKKHRLKTISLDESPANASEARDVADPHSFADQSLMDSTLEEPLQMALLATNPDFRMAVVLADVEGLPYEEIAQIMETSVGTVRSRIHRGRRQVRTYLMAHYPEICPNEEPEVFAL
jgi:RNA polymerase sigma-70 factor (ECF subfamily)